MASVLLGSVYSAPLTSCESTLYATPPRHFFTSRVAVVTAPIFDDEKENSPTLSNHAFPNQSPVCRAVMRTPSPTQRKHCPSTSVIMDIEGDEEGDHVILGSTPALILNGVHYPLRVFGAGNFHEAFTFAESTGSIVVNGEQFPLADLLVKQARVNPRSKHSLGNLDSPQKIAKMDVLGICNWLKIMWDLNAQALSSVKNPTFSLKRVLEMEQRLGGVSQFAQQNMFQQVIVELKAFCSDCARAGVNPQITRVLLILPNGLQIVEKIELALAINKLDDLLLIKKLITFMATQGHDKSKGEVTDLYPRNVGRKNQDLCVLDHSYPEGDQAMVGRLIADFVVHWADGNAKVADYLLGGIKTMPLYSEVMQQIDEYNARFGVSFPPANWKAMLEEQAQAAFDQAQQEVVAQLYASAASTKSQAAAVQSPAMGQRRISSTPSKRQISSVKKVALHNNKRRLVF